MSKPIGSLGFTSFILTRREANESQRAQSRALFEADAKQALPHFRQRTEDPRMDHDPMSTPHCSPRILLTSPMEYSVIALQLPT